MKEDELRDELINISIESCGVPTIDIIDVIDVILRPECLKLLAPKVIEDLEKTMDKTFEREDVWHEGELCFVSFKEKLFKALTQSKDILKVKDTDA